MSPWLMAAGLVLAGALGAAVLPRPRGLTATSGAVTRIAWKPVEGAALYRVAVFDAPDADGKRPLLAAVWVRGNDWDYGRGPVVAKAGRLASTRPLPLPRGRTLRVMVAAARTGGADKSEWSGENLRLPAGPTPVPTAAPTAVPAAVSGAAQPQAEDDGQGAQIELEGGDEFKSVPDPAVLDVNDGGAASGGSGTAGSDTAGSDTPADFGDDAGAPSLATAQALLRAGRFSQAEGQFRTLVKADPGDADAWTGLGDSLAAQRLKAEAYQAYSKVLQLDDHRERVKAWIEKNAPRQ